MIHSLLFFVPALVLATSGESIRLPRDPAISPDGRTIAFAWQGDVWTAAAEGGTATRLTLHPANDSSPFFSPDGRTIAFSSSRSGSSQIHVVPVAGGMPRQVSHGSISRRLLGYTPDGKGLLVSESTDVHFARTESARLFVLDLEGQVPKRMLFDAGAAEGSISPDGTKVLFTRGRASWSRKGYRGASAYQLWLADLTQDPPALTRIDQDLPGFQNVSWMNPIWASDGDGFYYVSDPDGTFDVYYRSLDGSTQERITNVGQDRSDDGVAFARLSADGDTLIYRRRFDLHRLELASGTTHAIELQTSGDAVAAAVERRTENTAESVAFSDDGKQIAFVAGDDVYVMDRILREPIRVTDDAHQESSPVFSADGTRLFFVSDASGEADIWEATHEQADGIWWLATEFRLRRVTDDRAPDRNLLASPTGEHIAYLKGTDVFVMDADGRDHRRVIEAWSAPSFDWSPDGKWLTFATQDDDYNSDIWIVPIDGTREPYNLSRHPDLDFGPVWSPEGTRLAFVSRRDGEEMDIYWFHLTKEEEEKTERDKKLEEALEAMKKSGAPKAGGGSSGPGGSGRGPGGGRRGRPGELAAFADDVATRDGRVQDDEPGDGEAKEGADEDAEEEAPKPVKIDFDGIHDRMHRISIPDSRESGLLWSPDGKKLAFTATIDGQSGLYTVEFPDVGTPTRMASSALSSARWLKSTQEIVGLSRGAGGGRGGFPGFGFGFGGGGTPAAMNARGETENFGFSVRHVRDWRALRQIAFDEGWRAMRDRFYDENMNHRNWDAIRDKYRPVAAQCLGATEFSELMNMMLGELNASHMGHRGGADPLPSASNQNAWTPTTYHLGLRFEPVDERPGRVVKSVIPGGPCSQERSLVNAGEILLAIDGVALDASSDLDRLLTMDQERDVVLRVGDREGNEREVTVRPVRSVQGLLYDEWVENTRKAVEEQSEGKLGYLHIRGMNMSSFRQMEEDLYHAGVGKDGLIIDVRFNGGGSTTDHVLTALTQPVHAITKSRGSGEGYPQDRKIYASWSKPIVLMCNEFSFSNAEILSHAVQQLGRGPVVGMRTGGGVISTGSARLLDGSTVRMPTRGWYLVSTGEDMELNGCLPDIALWNPPSGEDSQLETAVKALLGEVAKAEAAGGVEIVPAAVKRAREGGR